MASQSDKQMVYETSGRAHEVCNEKASARLENTIDFSQAAHFQILRQVMHHQAGSDNVNGCIWEWQRLDQTDAKINIKFFPRCFLSSDCDHLRCRINPI